METTVNGGDGRVRCFTDAQTGRMTFIQGDNVATFDAPKQRGGDGAALMEAEALTPAQKRLQRLRMGAGESVRRVDVEGDAEPYFVKQGSFVDFTHAATLAGRNKKAILSLHEPEELAGLVAAALHAFVIASESDKTPYFESLSEARAFVDDPAARDAVAMLFYAVASFNPECFPEMDKEASKKVWAALSQEGQTPTTFSEAQPSEQGES